MEQNAMHPTVSSEFKKRKMRQMIAAIPAILMVVLLLATEKAGPAGLAGIPITLLAPAALAVILAVVAFSLLNWRCPSCRKYLGKQFSPRFCPKCGVQLQS